MELKGKVALITGGGTGLGREIALQLAAEGMAVGINYSKSRQEAEATAADLEKLGVKAQLFQANVGNTAEIRAMLEQVDRDFGRLDLLINNAGTTRFIPFQDLEAVDEAAWDEIFAVNTRAAFFAAKAAIPLMRRNGGGQIINTSSIAGLGTAGSSLPYAVSKAALIHLTRCLAVALAPDIMVNTVAPGFLMTRWGALWQPDKAHLNAERALLGRYTDLVDTAATYIMLAKNNSVTGQVFTVDAGLLNRI
jgi:3-oxoacyl-[acyl-carrier protein] reductase